MKTVAVYPEVEKLLDDNVASIKDEYVTVKLFVDSAIREKMRRMKIKGVGTDQIITHLDNLRKSKARHMNQQAILQQRNRHKKRQARMTKELNEFL